MMKLLFFKCEQNHVKFKDLSSYVSFLREKVRQFASGRLFAGQSGKADINYTKRQALSDYKLKECILGLSNVFKCFESWNSLSLAADSSTSLDKVDCFVFDLSLLEAVIKVFSNSAVLYFITLGDFKEHPLHRQPFYKNYDWLVQNYEIFMDLVYKSESEFKLISSGKLTLSESLYNVEGIDNSSLSFFMSNINLFVATTSNFKNLKLIFGLCLFKQLLSKYDISKRLENSEFYAAFAIINNVCSSKDKSTDLLVYQDKIIHDWKKYIQNKDNEERYIFHNIDERDYCFFNLEPYTWSNNNFTVSHKAMFSNIWGEIFLLNLVLKYPEDQLIFSEEEGFKLVPKLNNLIYEGLRQNNSSSKKNKKKRKNLTSEEKILSLLKGSLLNGITLDLQNFLYFSYIAKQKK